MHAHFVNFCPILESVISSRNYDFWNPRQRDQVCSLFPSFSNIQLDSHPHALCRLSMCGSPSFISMAIIYLCAYIMLVYTSATLLYTHTGHTPIYNHSRTIEPFLPECNFLLSTSCRAWILILFKEFVYWLNFTWRISLVAKLPKSGVHTSAPPLPGQGQSSKFWSVEERKGGGRRRKEGKNEGRREEQGRRWKALILHNFSEYFYIRTLSHVFLHFCYIF